MSYSYTFNKTFTATHAKHLAAKVATDLKRIQRFYNSPTDSDILDYETEIAQLLKDGYLDTVTYGFKKSTDWIEPTVRYTAKDLSDSIGTDDDPGRVRPGADVSGASFYSFLTYTSAWFNLTAEERSNYKAGLPFQRGGADEPGVDGYLSQDKTYTSGSKSLNRFSVKKY